MVKMIGDNISLEEKAASLSIIIEGRLPRTKEAMLMAWLLIWFSLGVLVFIELKMGVYEKELRLALMIYLVFWGYFLTRIGRSFLWSRAGKELLMLKDGTLNLKRSIYGYGKSLSYDIQNIGQIYLSPQARDSFQYQIESSFWMIGGERVILDHLGKVIRVGRKIPDDAARQIVKRLNAKVKEMKNASAQLESDT